jgi:tetratricopeptide (TPR) repeat protein
MPYDNDAKKELVEFCRTQYVGNDTQLKVIDEFEQQYDHPSPIWWYTRECFIYRMLNKALRTHDTGMVLRMSFFLRDLHSQIEQLYMASNNRNHMIVFRGQGITHSEFDKIKRSKGSLLSFNNFLSTSMDRQVSFLYADSARQNRNLVGILFQIEIDPSISSIPFVSLGNISYFGTLEKEVLFSMHTVFRISDMKEIDNELWEVNLTLSGDNDKLLTPLTKYLRKEFEGESTLHRIGKLMIKMGQFDQAESMYNKLVHSTPDDDYHELGYLYHQLGLVKHEKGELKNAIAYYEKALEMKQKYLSSEHVDLAVTYTNIGSVYQSLEEYSTALQYYEKVLKIRQNYLPPGHELLAITYNNIGSTYQLMGEILTALSYYEKASRTKIDERRMARLHELIEEDTIGFQHKLMGEYSTALSYYQRHLNITHKPRGINHPLLTVTYSNIGSVYSSMKKYPNALSHYQKTLKIQQKVFPSYHPSFAITYNNIGLTYLSMEEYLESLSFYEKALEIQHKTLPPNHPELANTYMRTAKVLENLQRYKEAIEYTERAVKIVGQVFSAEHHTVKENQEYLNFLREKLQ